MVKCCVKYPSREADLQASIAGYHRAYFDELVNSVIPREPTKVTYNLPLNSRTTAAFVIKGVLIISRCSQVVRRYALRTLTSFRAHRSNSYRVFALTISFGGSD
ncbi:hypothetical protein AVEN_202838-1 [Araneus ventricosus]|uniref:Uncharacterized protein n=1 Tax=Araneus ventricosus TaxID=182803 RepID=A0A4Y2DNB9_ARAVE|nr:hypothetical protein AVEN_202838-1 [Araneus ventricosus]